MAEETIDIGHRIKARRKQLDLSLRDLAERADLTASFLSQVERGKANVSIDSLRRIAEAMNVSMLRFLEPAASDGRTAPSARSAAASESDSGKPDNGPQRPEYSPVLRADARPRLIFPDTGVTYELLTPDLGHQMEAICGRLAPGVENVVRPLREPTEEWIYVVSGLLKVGLENAEYVLAPGDSIYFEGYALRELVCAGDEEVVWISVITPPVF
jgi:transcriptional regulator with XRE-family HTH domain